MDTDTEFNRCGCQGQYLSSPGRFGVGDNTADYYLRGFLLLFQTSHLHSALSFAVTRPGESVRLPGQNQSKQR